MNGCNNSCRVTEESTPLLAGSVIGSLRGMEYLFRWRQFGCASSPQILARYQTLEITIFGTGYVGLVTGTCFAEAGNHVLGVDIDPNRIARLSQGESVIFEPGLSEMLQRNLKAGRIEFTTDAQRGIEQASVVFICVGTPPLAGWLIESVGGPRGGANHWPLYDEGHRGGRQIDRSRRHR